MTAQKLLNAQSIKLESYAPGRHYTTCPLCSKVRRKQHQANKSARDHNRRKRRCPLGL